MYSVNNVWCKADPSVGSNIIKTATKGYTKCLGT
jgi:hypothetical protein